MSAGNEAVDWRSLREFADVDLTQSFVLSWHFESETLFIDADILLLPDHPFYEKPRPAEKVCIRPALVEFPFCVSVSVDGSMGGGDISNVLHRLGHGAITGLQRRRDGRYEIRGEFGTVAIEAERPVMRLKGP
ncbi:MAG: hypothetical protein GWP60_06270 [Gammaproteobacteria bacterium]|jgi:hypothetical protein|nr:hypothetical protein [Gammaproteobacteria bacterium]